MRDKTIKYYQRLEYIFFNNPDRTAYAIIAVSFISIFILSFFRFALFDERLYLHETAVMADILRRGEWFGNYGVGVHGSLFKLPVALVYLVTGPSVFVATFFHIILATASAYIFYRILRDHFHLRGWMVLGLLLFVTNYSFVSWSITFHRETPVVFSLLLFIYFFLTGKRTLILGLLLLLVLEAKEYMFFAVAVSIFVWLATTNAKRYGYNVLRTVEVTLAKGFQLFFPSAIYTLLMLTTSLIPINMFLTSLLGLNKNAINYQIKHIAADNYETREPSLVYSATTKELSTLYQKTYKTDNTSVANHNDLPPKAKKLVRIVTAPLAYTEKLFYLSSFSFQSIPLIMLLPSIYVAITMFIQWREENKSPLMFVSIFLITYMVFYLIKVSHQRYLYPLLPITIAFFSLFVKRLYEDKLKHKQVRCLLATMTIVVLVMLAYPNSNTVKKFAELVTSSFILVLFYGYVLFKKRVLVVFSVLIISFVTLSISAYASLTKNQLSKSALWGVNGETQRIAESLDPNDKIYINETGITNENWVYMVNFYRADPALRPEWKWELSDWIPKKRLLKPTPNTFIYYNYPWENVASLRKLVQKSGINKIVLVKSTYGNIKFLKQDFITVLTFEDWLSLEKVVNLTNKDVYIFSVHGK